jgi:hypothetical protein
VQEKSQRLHKVFKKSHLKIISNQSQTGGQFFPLQRKPFFYFFLLSGGRFAPTPINGFPAGRGGNFL